ncbi:hypothetical protein M427DRAFT_309091 [Gonapodya prolifera JEL478]|uniref:Uncharacterized protein n=1 Tax=Gonapodya prolifera (strain JEL478) TaxID=1344416 RepID=A0A139AG50_GONPJ|nr:hypothetical protein M427DRAFT_309091 [Gonapodya prolifera JEL478]|eukprot:KXS15802.1 hypothetical protein M427DRAFT_309091 [Gonapodya prolifera JEL478]
MTFGAPAIGPGKCVITHNSYRAGDADAVCDGRMYGGYLNALTAKAILNAVQPRGFPHIMTLTADIIATVAVGEEVGGYCFFFWCQMNPKWTQHVKPMGRNRNRNHPLHTSPLLCPCHRPICRIPERACARPVRVRAPLLPLPFTHLRNPPIPPVRLLPPLAPSPNSHHRSAGRDHESHGSATPGPFGAVAEDRADVASGRKCEALTEDTLAERTRGIGAIPPTEATAGGGLLEPER